MGSFEKFDDDTLFLLSENQFNDSKEYYESVKETLKQKATVPMRQICSDLSEKLFEIDPQMNLIPTKMVSRIRRDTRFSKNKHLYRSNMWAMFMRDKHIWRYKPCMWFEITPGGYDMGVGLFDCEPALMAKYREAILENPKLFKKAVKSALDSGAVPDYELYKKPKPGDVPKPLSDYYNAKYIYFIKHNDNLQPLFDGTVIDELIAAVDAFAPMYQFLLTVTDKMTAEKGR